MLYAIHSAYLSLQGLLGCGNEMVDAAQVDEQVKLCLEFRVPLQVAVRSMSIHTTGSACVIKTASYVATSTGVRQGSEDRCNT